MSAKDLLMAIKSDDPRQIDEYLELCSGREILDDLKILGEYSETLRDKFAAKAMQGIIAAWGRHDVEMPSEIAHDAFIFADAMLAEREKSMEGE